jgi:hypothetical protein
MITADLNQRLNHLWKDGWLAPGIAAAALPSGRGAICQQESAGRRRQEPEEGTEIKPDMIEAQQILVQLALEEKRR